jgi:hypothetical protein
MHVLTPHRKGAGYMVKNVGLGAKERIEGDVLQCKHCDCVIIAQEYKEEGGFCSKCMAPVCLRCADRMTYYGCEPALKKIEAAFELGVKLAHFRKLAGLDVPPPANTKFILP